MSHDEHGMWIQDDIPYRERLNSCTSLTNHKEFEENGYFVVKDLYDPQFFYELPPKKPGKYDYDGNNVKVQRKLKKTFNYLSPYSLDSRMTPILSSCGSSKVLSRVYFTTSKISA